MADGRGRRTRRCSLHFVKTNGIVGFIKPFIDSQSKYEPPKLVRGLWYYVADPESWRQWMLEE